MSPSGLTPEFAADQAEAAIDAFWNKGEKAEEEPPSENQGDSAS